MTNFYKLSVIAERGFPSSEAISSPLFLISQISELSAREQLDLITVEEDLCFLQNVDGKVFFLRNVARLSQFTEVCFHRKNSLLSWNPILLMRCRTRKFISSIEKTQLPALFEGLSAFS